MTAPSTIAADPTLQRALVAEAARAPSVHNVQPACWRFLPDGRVALFRAVDRALPVADPTGHDVRLSLGAAWEGLAIALSRHRLALSEPEPQEGEEAPGLARVAEGRMVAGAGEDPLAAYVDARRSFRGRFRPAPPETVARVEALAGDDLRVVTGRERIAEAARLHDAATWAFVGQPAYHAELFRWLRLSPSHPDWARDGLNADCMALSRPERAAASVLLRPGVFRWLGRLGGAVVSEAPQIRSAAALLVIAPARALDDFAVGRRFHRLWLEATRAGVALTPLSALADHPTTRERLARECGIPETHRIANVFRAGIAPPEGAAVSPRLPVDELLV